MEVGSTVTWREGVMTKNKAGRPMLAGERVITGTIAEVRTSRCGTTDYKVDVEKVEGHEAATVKAVVWVKRQKLLKGRSWQRSRRT